MPLSPGTTLGPYEIQALLGAGGMGEVYKATDTRLDRTVAIKVLLAHVADDPDLRQRFEREAKAISSLNHPHICTLYDIGHAPRSGVGRGGPTSEAASRGAGVPASDEAGIDFLVMEYLEGETLAARLTKGPLPLDQVLRYATEIADALDKAHRQGVTHRDLKPANIMITKAGTKLLDFGLAKLRRPKRTDKPISSSATTTRATGLTVKGIILGTPQYMSPEQLHGEEADARSDIFAFGVIVYEMATGKKAFTGESQASLIAAILDSQPTPMSTLQPMSPPALDRVVRKCLGKDPEDRWQDVRDVTDELKWVDEAGSQAGLAVPAAVPAGGQSRLAWGVAAVTTVLAIALAVLYLNRAPIETTTARLSVLTELGAVRGLVLSPDGRQLAFTDGSRLWIRPLDSLESRALPGTEGAQAPFWSPDGRSIGFFTITELRTVDPTGGLPQTVCAVPGIGGTWNQDDVIVFGQFNGELLRVPAAGGEPAPVTTLDEAHQEVGHLWPQFLPDGEHFLFFAGGAAEQEGIYVGSLESGVTPSLLLRTDRMARYAAPGYLLFGRGQSLMAQPLDVERLALTGDPVRVVDGVRSDPLFRWLGFSASHQGALAYVGGGGGVVTQLRWLDRSGAELGTVAGPGDYHDPVLSPDETRVAVGRDGDVWILDLSRGTEQRFTFDSALDYAPLWSPDGSRIVFGSQRDGRPGDLYEKAATGTGQAQLLLESDYFKVFSGWSTDGEFVSYLEGHPETAADLWLLPMSGERPPTIFLQTPFLESDGMVSPDGRWMAYNSNESGEFQIYVQSVPPAGGKWQVSATGGAFPRWRGDGRELYYMSLTNDLMAVDVEGEGDTLEVGIPQRLFQLASNPTFVQRNPFDVAADGQRFLVNALVEESLSTPITWVLNWTAELEQ